MTEQQEKLARVEADLAIEEFIASAGMLEDALRKARNVVTHKADLANHDDEMPIKALFEVQALTGSGLPGRVSYAAGRCIGIAAMYRVFSND